MPEEDIKVQGNVEDDVDAIMKGIDRARTAPRVGFPDVPTITGELPNVTTITKFPQQPQEPSRRPLCPANQAFLVTFATLELSVA